MLLINLAKKIYYVNHPSRISTSQAKDLPTINLKKKLTTGKSNPVKKNIKMSKIKNPYLERNIFKPLALSPKKEKRI